jgi:hypothetical protein
MSAKLENRNPKLEIRNKSEKTNEEIEKLGAEDSSQLAKLLNYSSARA